MGTIESVAPVVALAGGFLAGWIACTYGVRHEATALRRTTRTLAAEARRLGALCEPLQELVTLACEQRTQRPNLQVVGGTEGETRFAPRVSRP